MIGWIQQHSTFLNIVLNFGMLLVWLIYAELIFRRYRRSQRPRLVISVTTMDNVGGELLVCNMSDNTTFIEIIMLCLHLHNGQERTLYFHDVQQQAGLREKGTGGAIKGALHSGEQINLGTLQDMLSHSLQFMTDNGTEDSQAPSCQDVEDVEIRVVAYYGPDRRPFAALRRFRYQPAAAHAFTSSDLFTKHMDSGRERRQVMEWLRTFYEPSPP